MVVSLAPMTPGDLGEAQAFEAMQLDDHALRALQRRDRLTRELVGVATALGLRACSARRRAGTPDGDRLSGPRSLPLRLAVHARSELEQEGPHGHATPECAPTSTQLYERGLKELFRRASLRIRQTAL